MKCVDCECGMFIAVGGVVHMYDEYQRRERHRQREKCKILTVRSGGRKLLHARPENYGRVSKRVTSPTFIATSRKTVLPSSNTVNFQIL